MVPRPLNGPTSRYLQGGGKKPFDHGGGGGGEGGSNLQKGGGKDWRREHKQTVTSQFSFSVCTVNG